MISLNVCISLECIYLTVKKKKKKQIYQTVTREEDSPKVSYLLNETLSLRSDNLMAVLIYNTTISSPDF